MGETVTLLVSALTALGVGGLAGAVVRYVIEQRQKVQSQHFEFKQRRYASIIITMIARISPTDDLPKLTRVRPDLVTLADVIRELDVELLNAFLYAADPVIDRLSEFNQNPSRMTLIKVADAMRRDLYRHTSTLSQETIERISGLRLLPVDQVATRPAA